MACPFFVPIEPWAASGGEPWSGPRRVPLGEPYRGKCSRTDVEIPDADQASCCNRGYARGRCRHFPNDDSTCDAHRFSMSGHNVLLWIAEREHTPVAHGESTYSAALDRFDPELPEGFRAQARAFMRGSRTQVPPGGLFDRSS